MAGKINPGKRCDFDAYKHPKKLKRHGQLPLNLLDALRRFEADTALAKTLGQDFAGGYVKLRTADWNSYAAHLTSWERERTLDC